MILCTTKMASKKAVESAVNECLSSSSKSFCIKHHQLEAINHIVNGKDMLCILPTGYGKSLIYQILPKLFLKLNNNADAVSSAVFTSITHPTVLVISPFLSLITNQVNEANSCGLNLRASALDSKLYTEIAAGTFNIIFGTPESWLQSKRWRNMLSNKFFSSNLIAIVVDEVHLVSCGISQKSETPFREIFGQISIIRSLCCTVPMLALSASVSHLIL